MLGADREWKRVSDSLAGDQRQIGGRKQAAYGDRGMRSLWDIRRSSMSAATPCERTGYLAESRDYR